jgi:hypothetical protein
LRWYDVSVPKDATSALDPFDSESSLRRTALLSAGRIADGGRIEVEHTDPDVYRSKIGEAAADSSRER